MEATVTPVGTTYRGRDLIDKTLEFISLVPEPQQWKESALKNHTPYLLRYRQIQGLAKAFFTKPPEGILEKAKSIFSSQHVPGIPELLSGEFIKYRSLEEYTDTMDYMKSEVRTHEGSLDESTPFTLDRLTMVYRYLIDFKRHLWNLVNFRSADLQGGSIPSRFTAYLADSISANLKDKYAGLDEALERLVNPHGLSFTKEELVEKYEYPKSDLKEVEADFRNKDNRR